MEEEEEKLLVQILLHMEVLALVDILVMVAMLIITVQDHPEKVVVEVLDRTLVYIGA